MVDAQPGGLRFVLVGMETELSFRSASGVSRTNAFPRWEVQNMRFRRRQNGIKRLNALLRSETLSIRGYRSFLHRNPDHPLRCALEEICVDHEASAQLLTQEILSLGGEPDADGGMWSEVQESLLEAADLMSPDLALRALRLRETSAVRHVRECIDSRDLTNQHAAQLACQVLPRQLDHVNQLLRL